MEKSEDSKKIVIPSEVDPFVHERISAVEGPAVSARSATGLHATDSLQAQSRFLHAPIDWQSPIHRLGRNDTYWEIA
jgi:hypothetical protein